MNIGIDARPLSYRLTGIGVYLKCLLDGLQKIDTQNRYFLVSNASINYDVDHPNWRKIEGNFRHKLISTLWLQVVVPRMARQFNLHIFWGTRHNLPLLLSRKTKTVLTIYDMTSQCYPATMDLPNLLIELLLKRASALKSDRIITISDSSKRALQTYFSIDPKKIRTIYPGIPETEAETDRSEDDHLDLPSKYFLFVGTMDPRKNLNRIFKAFEWIDPAKKGIHLVIAGAKGWKQSHFFAGLRNHPLCNYVKMTGYVSSSALQSLYQNALGLLFPSLYEGFGFPILEAMRFGTPVITSNRASMPEAAGNAALLVNPYSVREIADAMLQIIDSKSLRERLIQNGYQQVMRFSWKRCAQETLQLFEEVRQQ